MNRRSVTAVLVTLVVLVAGSAHADPKPTAVAPPFDTAVEDEFCTTGWGGAPCRADISTDVSTGHTTIDASASNGGGSFPKLTYTGHFTKKNRTPMDVAFILDISEIRAAEEGLGGYVQLDYRWWAEGSSCGCGESGFEPIASTDPGPFDLPSTITDTTMTRIITLPADMTGEIQVGVSFDGFLAAESGGVPIGGDVALTMDLVASVEAVRTR